MKVFNNRLGYIKSRNTPNYYAALYLLTSNYALFCAAKGLRHAGGVTESELADPMTIDDEAFRLIMNAMLIAKYGIAAFNLKGGISHEP